MTSVAPSTNKPSVWILNQYALPEGAMGITRHGDLARVLVKRGHDVTVIASSFDNFKRTGAVASRHAAYSEALGGVTFVWLPTPTYAKNDGRRVRSMVDYYFRALNQAGLAATRPPAVVIGSSPHLLSALAGARLAKRFGAKFVLELRDVWPDDLVALGALREGSVVHRALASLARWLERRADLIVTVPPKLAPSLVERGIAPSKLLDLPNGVFVSSDDGLTGDTASADAATVQLPESFQSILSRTHGSFVVTYMGAHGVANDLGNLLAAADLLRLRHPAEHVDFVLVGGGQQRDELMMRAKQQGLTRVHFHEPVPKAMVPAVAASADALLVHLHAADTFSRFGRSPNKLYDYLAAARPVLFSTNDKETIVDRAGAGFTFAPGDPIAFANAVLRLKAIPADERRAMGMRGREAVLRDHDLSKLGGRLSEALTGLVDESYGAEADARSAVYSDSLAPRSGARPE